MCSCGGQKWIFVVVRIYQVISWRQNLNTLWRSMRHRTVQSHSQWWDVHRWKMDPRKKRSDSPNSFVKERDLFNGTVECCMENDAIQHFSSQKKTHACSHVISVLSVYKESITIVDYSPMHCWALHSVADTMQHLLWNVSLDHLQAVLSRYSWWRADNQRERDSPRYLVSDCNKSSMYSSDTIQCSLFVCLLLVRSLTKKYS